MSNKSGLKRIINTILVSLVLAVFFSLFASPAISPLYGVYEGSNFTYDPPLFKYEALAILNGQKPYIDLYDHKGIWHLGIYVLAMLINKRYGLFILEIISGAITIYFYIECIKVLTSSLTQRLIALFFFGIIRFLVGQGATIGMWLLPFIAIYLYFYLKAIKEDKDGLFIYGSVSLGLAVSFALNSRPVDMTYVWGGVFYILMYSAKEKKFSLLIKNSLAAFISFIIPVIVITIIAIANGFFVEMLEAIFLENFRYVSRSDELLVEGIVFRILSAALLALYIILYLIYKKNVSHKRLNTFFLVMAIATFLPLAFTVKFFSHFLGVIPFAGASLIFFIEASPKENGLIKKLFLSFSGVIAFSLSLTPVLYYTVGIGDFSYSRNEKDIKALLNSIPEEDRVNGNIYAVDCSCQVYHLLDVVGEAKYYCNQTWWSYSDASIMEESLTFVKETKPKYVILWKNTLDERWEKALDEYTLIDESAARFYIYKIN